MFTKKIIQCTFTSGSGSFTPLNTQGLRTTFHGLAAGADSMAEADLLIYGLSLSVQNQLSTLGWQKQKPGADSVTVFAGDAESGMAMVYKGTIFAAFSDYQGGPNVPLHVTAHTGTREAGLRVSPTSINNKSADVAGMFSTLAGQMGLQFENNGVSVKLSYPYLPGDPRTQARELANHADVRWTIDRGTLAIWPKDGSRSGNVTVGPGQGLVGYPAWSAQGVVLRVEYSPAMNFQIGGQVTVQGSSIAPANGTWTITRCEYNLQSETPGGSWFVNLTAGAKAGTGQPPVATP
jgi:hypothetical protein